MKRSKYVALLLMGAGSLALTACDEANVDAAVFESLKQCTEMEGFRREDCEASFAEAQAQHAKVAPKYASKTECEAEFGPGQCETAPQQAATGGGIFMPMMMGYLMGSMMSRGMGAASQPLYRTQNDPGNFRTADNNKVAARPGAVKLPDWARSTPKPATTTVSRGGFGSTAQTTGSTSGTRSFGG